jgi:mono/diheme cytochrome c family protein
MLLAVLVLAVAAFGLYGWLTAAPLPQAMTASSHTADAANGAIIFNAGGCSSCHATPGQPDRLRLGGGLAIPTQFGTFYAPSISPDPADGIGGWSEADFVAAVMKGISPAGTHYFPVFPYTSYAHARPDDVRDLFAYLKTLPPVAGRARAHDVRFPFDIRRNIGIWKLLFMDDTPFAPDPSRSQRWNRGAYLVNSLGHCAECHSPRNVLGGIVTRQRFAGGPNPEGEGWVPNITQKGLADWSEKDIAFFSENGGDARRRQRRRLHGARDQEHGAAAGRRPSGDRRLSEVAAAG